MNKKEKYKFLIFDADHTLLDFELDEKNAFRRTFTSFEIVYTEENIQYAFELSAKIWEEMGLNNVGNPSVQEKFHRVYLNHIDSIFDILRETMKYNISSQELKETFIKELCVVGNEIQDALSLFKKLSKDYYCCIATNGIEKIQQGRLKSFLPFTYRLFISETINTIKPNPKFFSWVLRELNATSKECLMIGDSLLSDIKGAKEVKMDNCWFNPKNKINKSDIHPFIQIEKLNELLEIL